MKLSCEKNELIYIINIVQKAVATKTPHAILECIKINAEDDGHVTFTANSTELCIEYSAEMNIYQGGTVALPAKIFGEIARRLPEGIVNIDVNEENFVTDIKCGLSMFNIQGMSAEEFPDADIVDENYRVNLNENELKNIIRRVVPFISPNEVRRQTLTGALFDIKGNTLNVVGTDSHRLAVIKTTLSGNIEQRNFIIPGATLSKIGAIMSDDEEKNVSIIVSDKSVMFDFGTFVVYSRLLSGNFLRYEGIISVRNSIRLKVNKADVTSSLERANLIINEEIAAKTDNKLPVKMDIADGRINISCRTSRSCVNDYVEVEHEGGELLIGLNCRFMLDALAACDDEIVIMEFSAPNSGCFIRPEDESDRYTYMVLPVRLYN